MLKSARTESREKRPGEEPLNTTLGEALTCPLSYRQRNQ